MSRNDNTRHSKEVTRRRANRPKYSAPGSSRREHMRFVSEVVALIESRTAETTTTQAKAQPQHRK